MSEIYQDKNSNKEEQSPGVPILEMMIIIKNMPPGTWQRPDGLDPDVMDSNILSWISFLNLAGRGYQTLKLEIEKLEIFGNLKENEETLNWIFGIKKLENSSVNERINSSRKAFSILLSPKIRQTLGIPEPSQDDVLIAVKLIDGIAQKTLMGRLSPLEAFENSPEIIISQGD